MEVIFHVANKDQRYHQETILHIPNVGDYVEFSPFVYKVVSRKWGYEEGPEVTSPKAINIYIKETTWNEYFKETDGIDLENILKKKKK